MKIGVNLNCYGPLPLEEQFALMKRHGFETTFCMSEKPDIEAAFAIAKREGIVFENLHAPYREIIRFGTTRRREKPFWLA